MFSSELSKEMQIILAGKDSKESKPKVQNEIDFIRENPSKNWKLIQTQFLSEKTISKNKNINYVVRKLFDPEQRRFALDLNYILSELKNSPLGENQYIPILDMLIFQERLCRKLNFGINVIINNLKILINKHNLYVKHYANSKTSFLPPAITDEQIGSIKLIIDRLYMVHAHLRNDKSIIEESTNILTKEYKELVSYVRRSEFVSTRDLKEELQKLQNLFVATGKKIDFNFRIDRAKIEEEYKAVGDFIKDATASIASFFLGPLGFRVASIGFDLLAILANLAAVKFASFLGDDGTKKLIGEAFFKPVENDESDRAGTRDLTNFARQIDRLTTKLHAEVLSKLKQQVEKVRIDIYKECDEKKYVLGREELKNKIIEKVNGIISQLFTAYDEKVLEITKKLLGEKKEGVYFLSAQIIAPLHALAYKLTFAEMVFNQHPDFAENPVANMLICLPIIEKQMLNREGDEKIIDYVKSLDKIWCDKAKLEAFGFIKEEGLFSLHTRIQYGRKNTERGELRKKTALALLSILKIFECHCKTILPEMMEPKNIAKAIIDIAALGMKNDDFLKHSPNFLYEIFNSIPPMREMFSNQKVKHELNKLLTLSVSYENKLYMPVAADFLKVKEVKHLKYKRFQAALSLFVAAQEEKLKLSKIDSNAQIIPFKNEINNLSKSIKLLSIKHDYLVKMADEQKDKIDLLGYDKKDSYCKEKLIKPYKEYRNQIVKINKLSLQKRKERYQLKNKIKEQEMKMGNSKDYKYYCKKMNLLSVTHINNVDKLSEATMQLMTAFDTVLFNTVKTLKDNELFLNSKNVFEAQAIFAELFQGTFLLASKDGDPVKSKAKSELFNSLIEKHYRFFSELYLQKLIEKPSLKMHIDFNHAYHFPLPVCDVITLLENGTQDQKDLYCFKPSVFPWGDDKQKIIMPIMSVFKLIYIPIIYPCKQHWSLIRIKNTTENLDIEYIDSTALKDQEKICIKERLLHFFRGHTISVNIVSSGQQDCIFAPESDFSANFMVQEVLNSEKSSNNNFKNQDIELRKKHIMLLLKHHPVSKSVGLFANSTNDTKHDNQISIPIFKL